MTVLQFLHENGYNLNEIMCETAIKYGCMRVLDFLHKNGLRWNHKMSMKAAEHSQLGVLEWAYDRGYSLEFEDIDISNIHCLEILEWINFYICSVTPWLIERAKYEEEVKRYYEENFFWKRRSVPKEPNYNKDNFQIIPIIPIISIIPIKPNANSMRINGKIIMKMVMPRKSTRPYG